MTDFVERCGAVNPQDGRFCIKPKGHEGKHGTDETGSKSPYIPVTVLPFTAAFAPWWPAFWGFTPKGFRAGRFIAVLLIGVVLPVIILTTIFASIGTTFQSNCTYHTTTTGNGSDEQSDSSYSCR